LDGQLAHRRHHRPDRTVRPPHRPPVDPHLSHPPLLDRLAPPHHAGRNPRPGPPRPDPAVDRNPPPHRIHHRPAGHQHAAIHSQPLHLRPDRKPIPRRLSG